MVVVIIMTNSGDCGVVDCGSWWWFLKEMIRVQNATRRDLTGAYTLFDLDKTLALVFGLGGAQDAPFKYRSGQGTMRAPTPPAILCVLSFTRSPFSPFLILSPLSIL